MEEVRGQAHHVGVAVEGEDVLGEFLDWVFGEYTETTANDAAEKPSPSQEPQKQGEKYPAPFPSPISQLLSATFFSLCCWYHPRSKLKETAFTWADKMA